MWRCTIATSCSVSITGTPTGATCISYSNCELGCCNKGSGGCSGTNTYNCRQWVNKIQCDAHPRCCSWYDTGAACNKKTCISLGESDCTYCGCTSAWTCTAKACASLAGTYKNPDMCAGCNTCGATWNVDSVRTLPWNVYVTTQVTFATGGQIALNSKSITTPAMLGPGSVLGPGGWYY